VAGTNHDRVAVPLRLCEGPPAFQRGGCWSTRLTVTEAWLQLSRAQRRIWWSSPHRSCVSRDVCQQRRSGDVEVLPAHRKRPFTSSRRRTRNHQPPQACLPEINLEVRLLIDADLD